MTIFTLWNDSKEDTPREAYDNLSTFVSFNRYQQHGDHNAIDKLIDEIRATNKISDKTIDKLEMRDLHQVLELALKSGIIAAYKPLYIYSHSGSTIATTPFQCRFDSWQYGFAYITKSEACEEYGFKRISKKAKTILEERIESEVQDYDIYLTQGWIGFTLKDEANNFECGDGGFLGFDPNINGMKDQIPEEYHELLTNYQID